MSLSVNVIDAYQFGRIVVNGKEYTSDVVIFPDTVNSDWWRKTGHELCLEDIAEVITGNPETLIIGTGASGLMKVLPEVRLTAQAQDIKLIVETTDKACSSYNQLCHSQKVVAALHITC